MKNLLISYLVVEGVMEGVEFAKFLQRIFKKTCCHLSGPQNSIRNSHWTNESWVLEGHFLNISHLHKPFQGLGLVDLLWPLWCKSQSPANWLNRLNLETIYVDTFWYCYICESYMIIYVLNENIHKRLVSKMFLCSDSIWTNHEKQILDSNIEMSGCWSCFAYQCTAGKSMLWHLPGPPQFYRNLLWDTHFNTALSILFARAFLGNQKVSWWNSMKKTTCAPKQSQALFYIKKKQHAFQCFNFKFRDYLDVSPADVWRIITTQKKW